MSVSARKKGEEREERRRLGGGMGGETRGGVRGKDSGGAISSQYEGKHKKTRQQFKDTFSAVSLHIPYYYYYFIVVIIIIIITTTMQHHYTFCARLNTATFSRIYAQ
jgi:hypothetical protein